MRWGHVVVIINGGADPGFSNGGGGVKKIYGWGPGACLMSLEALGQEFSTGGAPRACQKWRLRVLVSGAWQGR